jgi:hypothetical protein
LQLNITTLIASQNHEQHYGIEHIAVQTDDYPGTLAKLKANDVGILEEMPPNNGRHVCFLEAPDGAQMKLIEKVKQAPNAATPSVERRDFARCIAAHRLTDPLGRQVAREIVQEEGLERRIRRRYAVWGGVPR